MKNRFIAALLAIFLGGFGVHKFYLGKWNGIFYLLLCWTYVWGIERSGFFNGREKWAKGFENQRV